MGGGGGEEEHLVMAMAVAVKAKAKAKLKAVMRRQGRYSGDCGGSDKEAVGMLMAVAVMRRRCRCWWQGDGGWWRWQEGAPGDGNVAGGKGEVECGDEKTMRMQW